MRTVIWKDLSEAERQEVLTRPAVSSKLDIVGIVTDIVDRIKKEKDQALLEFTAKLDHVTDGKIRLTAEEISEKCAAVPQALKDAIVHAKENISAFHEQQKTAPVVVHTQPGITCELHTHAIDNVGLYVPGGSAPLVSTVLMLAIPAQIAGCKRVAMAYGTETVGKVDKIFGPGNAFVTEAKKQVSKDNRGASIDMPAGPSEVLVIADRKSNPAFVASDLLSQAEHGPDSQVILVTEDLEFSRLVEAELEKQLAVLPRRQIAEKALSASRIIICDNMNDACEISNEYAPEHLILQVENARSLLPQLRNAGSIFVGAWTPESAGDYASGTNHTLPTYGYAKTYSSLGLADYMRRYTVQELTADALKALSGTIIEMTNAEGLMAHQRAVTVRTAQMKGDL